MCGSIIAAIPSNGTACNGLGAGLQLYPRLCAPFLPLVHESTPMYVYCSSYRRARGVRHRPPDLKSMRTCSVSVSIRPCVCVSLSLCLSSLSASASASLSLCLSASLYIHIHIYVSLYLSYFLFAFPALPARSHH